MRLADGAEAIQGDLPTSATVAVDVPIEAGDSEDSGVNRCSALVLVRDAQAAALRAAPDWALTIGGDCGVSLAAVEHASRQHPGEVAVVWLDAQPDLHTPQSSPSGAFTGMVLRAISGEGTSRLTLGAGTAIPLDRVVLGGTRDIDAAEAELIREHSISIVSTDEFSSPDALVAAVRRTGATQVYLHIDLDVLDPAEINGLDNPVPFGISVEALTTAVTGLRAHFGLAGATIAGFAPMSPEAATDDLSNVLRVIGSLTR